jgi:hypothetical protein
MSRRVLPAVFCGLSCATLASAPTRAADEAGPWLTALGAAFVVTDLSTGDLDGDGRDETVVCYRENLATTNQGSGIVVYVGRGPQQRPAFHAQLDGALCEKVRVSGRKLGVLLQGNKQLAWTYGEDLHFRGDKRSLVHPKSVKASSSTGSAHGPTKAFDNDLATSWAEGADGTGIGQSITIQLDKGVDIGAVGIFCGEGSSQRGFFDHNRMHRGSIEAKTEADLGDSSAGFDFASLGIDAIGDRIEFNCENRPEVTYVPLHKRGVVELEVRIESVYLGDKKDDTHIAEIELVPRLGQSQTLDRATAAKPRPESTTGTTKPESGVKVEHDVDSPTAALDAQGRVIAVEDDL